jgi:Uma2 family endonuclease
MSKLQLKIPADTWIGATWDEALETLENPLYEKAKSYYYQQELRIEMAPVGANHADNNGIILLLVNLWGIGRSLPLKVFVNCSYRQQGIKEAQPDVSYYIGDRIKYAPTGNKVVNLDNNQPPDLAIEIAVSSLMDDLGPKRMLYEDLGVAEYWVVDAEKDAITAFEIIPNRGSKRIDESVVLPGLKMALLTEGLRRSRQTNNTEVASWFLAEIGGGSR